MNPFTRFLSRGNRNQPLQALIEHCDALEALVIQVYKTRQVTAEDEADYAEIRGWMGQHYGQWQEDLSAYWPQASVGGKPAPQDPFLRLIAAAQARDFIGDWEAMQYLPAMRQALNQLILASE